MDKTNQLYICITCKDKLTKDLFVENKKLSLGIEHQCKKCRAEYQKKYREANKSKIKKYYKNYRTKEFYAKRRQTETYKKARAKKRKKEIENLEKGYLRVLLYKKGIQTESLNEDIIEVQRLIIKTKRLCKTLKN